MRKIIIIATLALSLSGCANLQNAFQAATAAEVSPKAVIVAANTFNALEATATNYLRLPRCTPVNRPVCRDPAITKQVIPAVRSGRVARDSLIAFMRSHPGQLAPQGVFDALRASIDTLNAIISKYAGASK